jgi:hypothetical protein
MDRYLGPYGRRVTGNRELHVERLRASGELERAAPYLPKGEMGKNHTVAELEYELLRTGKFDHFGELLGNGRPFEGQRFGDLVAAPTSPFDPAKHFTRAQGLRNSRTIRSDTAATGLAEMINASRPVLYHVVAERA